MSQQIEDKIKAEILKYENQQKQYTDTATKANQTLEQAKLLAYSCQEKVAVLKELLVKEEVKQDAS